MAVIKISEQITYKEATHSNTAIRRRMRNEPDEKQLAAMKILAQKVFEPLKIHFGEPIRVNSFFRSRMTSISVAGTVRIYKNTPRLCQTFKLPDPTWLSQRKFGSNLKWRSFCVHYSM